MVKVIGSTPLAQLQRIKTLLKQLYDDLEDDNNHKANCHVEIALNHLRLTEYEIEAMYE